VKRKRYFTFTVDNLGRTLANVRPHLA